jgi:hypothetical protein
MEFSVIIITIICLCARARVEKFRGIPRERAAKNIIYIEMRKNPAFNKSKTNKTIGIFVQK